MYLGLRLCVLPGLCIFSRSIGALGSMRISEMARVVFGAGGNFRIAVGDTLYLHECWGFALLGIDLICLEVSKEED